MADQIVPVTRSLYLCDFHAGYDDGRVDLYGVHNALRPAVYPHARRQLVVFAKLTDGIGDVPFYLDIRRADEDIGIRTTPVRTLRFTDRTAVVQLAVTIENIRFPEPGVYVVDLFCHDDWVCDATVTLN